MSVNNTVNDQSTFNYITIVNPDSCRETVEVSQPLVNVIEVATVGPAGSTGLTGANGSPQPFSNVSGSIWATTSSIQITGSFTVSGSSTFTNIGLAVFTGSVVINGYSALTSNDTGSFLISNSFNSFSSSYYADSGSVSNRITNLELFSSSLDSTFATDSQLNSATASLSSSISSLNSSFQLFSGSYNTGSFTGVFYGTSSWSTNSITASYAPDYVLNASTSSMLQPYVLNSSTSSFVLNSQTSSMTVLSSSFSSTASFINPLNQNVSVNGNVSVTGSIYIPDNTYGIYFSGSSTTSKLIWNDTDGTLDLGLKGGNVTLQIGQEQVVRVVNKTGISLTEAAYQVVKISGAQGNRLKVALALGDSDVNSADTIGIVTEDISLNQEGFVTNSGLVRAINTTGALQGETWNDGDVLYLSPTTAGAITNIKPQAPQHTVILGFVVNAHPTQGAIFVKVDNGYEIDELHNVRITTASLTAGNLLVRNSNNVWVNSNQLTGSYFVTGSVSATSFTGSLFGTASWANRSTSSSFASTASYINTLNQNLSIFGNLSVFGTASFVQITGSVLQVGTNIITLNTDNPSVRFGGISVVDSGSFGTSSTGSLLWDSQNNRWVYSNPSGSTYDGGLLISGPRNTSGLGNESGMDANFVAVGQGADHIQPGTIYNSGSITIVTGSLTVTQGITGSLFGTASWSSNAVTASFAPDYVLMSVTSSMLSSYVLNSQTSSFVTNAVTASMLQPYVLNSSTSSFVLNSQTSSFVTNAVTASMLSFYVLSTATSSFVTNSQTSSFVLNASTSSMLQPYVLTNITSSMLQPYVLNASTSSMSVLSSSFASTASYISPTFISASAAASGFGSGGSSGITVGTTTITSGTSGRIAFNNSGVYGESANLFWDNSNNRQGILTSTPTSPLQIGGTTIVSGSTLLNWSNWDVNIGSSPSLTTGGKTALLMGRRSDSSGDAYIQTSTTGTDYGRLFLQYFSVAGSLPTVKGVVIIGDGSDGSNAAKLNVTNGPILVPPVLGANPNTGGSTYSNGMCYALINPTYPSGIGLDASYAMWFQSAPTIGTGFKWYHSNTRLMTLSNGGKLGVGENTPTAYLHLGAGSIAANSAPIKINSGSLMTTPEVGAIEYNGTQLFFTPSSTRNILAQISGSTALSTGQIPFATTNGYLTSTSNLFWDNTNSSLIISSSLTTAVRITQTNSGSFVVYSIPTASYDTAFFEYSIKSGSNARAGAIMAIQSGNSVNFTETTTTDFGDTTGVSFTVIVTGSNMALTGSSTAGAWTIKSIVRNL